MTTAPTVTACGLRVLPSGIDRARRCVRFTRDIESNDSTTPTSGTDVLAIGFSILSQAQEHPTALVWNEEVLP